LHNVDWPSEETLQNLSESRAAEVQLAQSVCRAHASWNSYWTIAVNSFDRLAEYSRLSCLGDQAQALQIWQALCAGGIPETMSQKLHELCGDLNFLAEVCRNQRGGSSSGSWAQVGATLAALLDMVHFNGSLEWPELMHRVGTPAPKRTAPPTSGSAQPGPGRIDEAAARPQPEFASAGPGSGSGNSISVLAAGAPAAAPVSLVKAFVMPPEAGAAEAVASEPTPAPAAAASPVQEALSDEPVAFASSDTSPTGGFLSAALDTPAAVMASGSRAGFSPIFRQRAVPAVSTYAEFPVPAAPSFAQPVSPTQAMGVLQGSLPGKTRGGNEIFEVYEDPKAPVQNSSAPSPPGTIGMVPSSPVGTRVFEHPEEREHEALKILRQVESEVRTLKRWYTEAIEAMRSPNPYPAPAEGL